MDWLGKKWYFLCFSLLFSVAGVISMGMHWARIGSPVPLGVDFQGGTQVQVQFQNAPDANAIRQATDAAGIKDAKIVTFDDPAKHEMLISLPTPSDGVVLLDETKLQGIRDHVTYRINHFGLLLSKRCAAQVASFLATGKFAQPSADGPSLSEARAVVSRTC